MQIDNYLNVCHQVAHEPYSIVFLIRTPAEDLNKVTPDIQNAKFKEQIIAVYEIVTTFTNNNLITEASKHREVLIQHKYREELSDIDEVTERVKEIGEKWCGVLYELKFQLHQLSELYNTIDEQDKKISGEQIEELQMQVKNIESMQSTLLKCISQLGK